MENIFLFFAKEIGYVWLWFLTICVVYAQFIRFFLYWVFVGQTTVSCEQTVLQERVVKLQCFKLQTLLLYININ